MILMFVYNFAFDLYLQKKERRRNERERRKKLKIQYNKAGRNKAGEGIGSLFGIEIKFPVSPMDLLLINIRGLESIQKT